MSRYEWPRDTARQERTDDPGARSGYNARRRRAFDPDAILQASRSLLATELPGDGMVLPAAVASGREHLWQPLGPISLLNGQAEGNPRVSGRVNAICVHEAGQRAYAASANGGVWYTKDGGANWVSVAGLASTNTAGILRPAQRNACGALHVDFGTNEGDDIVFLGTGEVTHDLGGQPGKSEGGIGIFVGDKPTKSAAADPWVREAPNLVNDGVYQIVREPGGTTMIAATRSGLYQRPAAPAVDTNWDRVSIPPFDTITSDCSDALWTPANGGRPARLWVWVKEGTNAGLWMHEPGATEFHQVVVDASATFSFTPGRACLAASKPATQIWVFNDFGNVPSPGLFRVTSPVSGPAKPIAHGVVGVPNVLRDSGFYNIAIAVDPANPNRVALAGSYLGNPYAPADADALLLTTLDGARRWFDASIVVADVAANPANANRLTYGHPTPFTMVGIGVHPDVHALAYSNNGATLWVGCDGGIARSDAPASPVGFYPRNNGMSISESNYLAAHPRCEGNLVVGLQDNGVVQRLSTGVWIVKNKGDGGGVIMDASSPNRWMAQYIKGTWNLDPPGGTGPLVRTKTFFETESKSAAFYSSAACIAHVRSVPPAADVPISQTIIGTNRLWYSDNFGTSWVTLPTGTDPLPASPGPLTPITDPALPIFAQDPFGQQIRVCKWQSPDVAWVLGEQRIVRYARTPGSHNAGGPGTWTSAPVMPPGFTPTGKAKKRPPAPASLLDASIWTEIAVNLDPPPGPNQPPAQHGTLGAIYIGTTGNPDKANTDTLWWFDGTDKWHPTGLRTKPQGVPAPVTAIICNPALPLEVWVGTTVGVWLGTRTDNGANPPTWEWQQRVNGLPEASVEDLALFSDGTLVLLRAAIAARGIWELRLDQAIVQDRTYLRAHDDDLRYRDRAIDKQRDLVTDRSWHGSPDIRPRVAPAALAAPASLVATPWNRTTFSAVGNTEQLRRFQAALRASTNDPRIVANGIWDAYFSEILREHSAPVVAIPAAPPLPALSRVQIDETYWNTHMAPNGTAEPWGAGTAGEADLYELTPRLREGELKQTSCQLPAVPLKVDIVVHQRGLGTLDGANLRVTLLWWTDPKPADKAKFDDSSTWFPDDITWTTAVNEVLNSGDGKTSQVLDSGWKFALGNDTESHRIALTGQTLDPTRSGVATFALDLTGLAANTVVVLAAIIHSGTNSTLSAAKLPDLVLNNHTVAVRSIQVV